MECNKEEAIRAKGIAEKKMQNNDFAGARKIALKAQQLYNDLENISQMIMVCDVHCSAENKMLGNETDWYGILQIEHTANEDTIKKQYRKFALQLHPDKNKFPGAETAFKLIVEAQRVLLDRGKRSLHDLKHKASVSRPAAHYQPSPMPTYPNVRMQNNSRYTFTGSNFQHQKAQQPVQSGISNDGPTFWTMCPFCTVRYQYYRKVINKSINCQTCNKLFIAYERGEQGVPMATNWSQPVFRHQRDVPNKGACKVEQVVKENFTADNSKTVFSQKTGCTSDFGKEKVNSKRGRKQAVESSESCDTESSSDSEVDMAVDESVDFRGGENGGRNTDQYPRRSSRRKQQVSYKENLSDDDLLSHPKRAKAGGSSSASGKGNRDAMREEVPEMDNQTGSAATVKNEQKESTCFGDSLSNVKNTRKVSGKEIANENGCEKSSESHADDREKSSEAIADHTPDSSSRSAEEPELYDYPDQDFNDFDKDRKEECFKVNQMWSLYDTIDGMPRFYARIRKVFPSGFKLRITWLEPDPDDKKEIEWVNKGLTFSCGKFKHGASENTSNRLIFSHLVSWEKGSRRDTYEIYPKKGQIWALFKGWDFNWISDADSTRKYDYEFVEILADYAEDVGTSVGYLAKVKGFASVFCRKSNKGGIDSVKISPCELLRFSHRVPSFTLTGEEKEGVLKGSFELDLASLPQNLEEIVPEILEEQAGGSNSDCLVGLSDKDNTMMGSEGCRSAHQDEVKETHLEAENDRLPDNVAPCGGPSSSILEAIEIPEPEFFNFDAEKSEEKLQIGQIWSLYCDEDGLPKYYGQIAKIESEPAFKLHLRWLESCSLPINSIQWRDEDMPVSCGRFKLKRSKFQKYTSTGSFSHKVRAECAGENEFTILPGKGEIWALYRNWNAEIECSDLENCEYDVVEILKANDLHIEVLFLERTVGFNSVFKPQGGTALMKISLVEILRFSHQIPAFKLSEERDGNLRGFWELDPAALPARYFLL